jgi:hypothetical protein
MLESSGAFAVLCLEILSSMDISSRTYRSGFRIRLYFSAVVKYAS